MKTKPVMYDYDKLRDLRMKVVECAFEVLEDSEKVKGWSAYKKELVMKMANRVLPTLNEHSGSEDNKTPIPIAILGGVTKPTIHVA